MSKENRKEDALVFQQLGQEWLPLFEVLVDQLFNEGILREIPIVRTILTFIKTGKTISDYFFNRKLTEVLSSLSGLDPKTREEYIRNWQEDANRAKVTEHLFLIVNQINDMDKPRLLGALFKAYLADEISDFEEFKKMTIILDNVFVKDIQVLIESNDMKNENSQRAINNLSSSGMSIPMFDASSMSGFSGIVSGPIDHALNGTGIKMIEIFKKYQDNY